MKILMVSTEYPPMRGGVGRYGANLVQALRERGTGIEVDVVCNEDGEGNFRGISPSNERNSDVLLKIVEEQSRPDVVHVQFEPGLYGLILDSANPSASRTFIDQFYHRCKVPIITTFHSAYTLSEWMGQGMIVKHDGRIGKLGIPLRAAIRTWKCLVNYQAAISQPVSKAEARARFSLPQDKLIAVAIGFGTATKGWDILSKIEMPNGWIMVLNSSKGHFNREQDLSYRLQDRRIKKGTDDNTTKVIDLQRGFLTDEELSILFYASDVVVLPYKITSGSGVMFDALTHRVPFVASDLDFFKEFEEMGLGITAKRDPTSFAKAINTLGKTYDKYSVAVDNFRQQLRWEYVANQHIEIYNRAIKEKKRRDTIPTN
jgi:glycosyltransferase involved in cell wall biosynthesis